MSKASHEPESEEPQGQEPPAPPPADDQTAPAGPARDDQPVAPPQPEARGPADLQAERDDLLGRLQRLAAEFANYQKRVQRETAEACQYANSGLIRELLVVLDDLERAIAAARQRREQTGAGEDDPLLEGVRLVHDKALDILERHGLRPIQAEGRPFDPTRHQALVQEPSTEHAAPTVLRQLQRGYELHGRVLRPAGVVVSSPAAAERRAGDDERVEEDD